MLRIRLITLLLLALLFAGCSGFSTVDTQNGEEPRSNPGLAQIAKAGLPPLPQDHASSTAQERWVYGKNTFDSSANTVDDDLALVLLSGVNNPAWGIWHFNPALEYIDSIEVSVDVTPSDRIWLAISDYTRGAWQFVGAFTSDHTIVVDESRHRSEDGDLYIAAVALEGHQPTVEHLMAATDDGWVIVTVDSGEGIVGAYPSLALVGGRPAISYNDCTNGNLKYAYSMTATGDQAEDWICSTADDSDNDVGRHTSLTEVKGQPAISYYDATEEALRYARRMLTIPPAQPVWVRVLVDTDKYGTSVGKYSSLAVRDDHLAISYYDESNDNLLCAMSLTETGTDPDDWFSFILDDSGDSGLHCSLAVVGGDPAFSYCSVPSTDLRYRLLPDLDAVTVDSDSSYIKATSLKVVDGNPAIGFLRANALMYAYSTTPLGTAEADWNTIEIHNALFCYSASLAVIDGRPALTYWSTDSQFTEAILYFAWSETASGHNSYDWVVTSPIIEDPLASEYEFQSLLEVDGKPAVAFHSMSPSSLKYAIRMGR